MMALNGQSWGSEKHFVTPSMKPCTVSSRFSFLILSSKCLDFSVRTTRMVLLRACSTVISRTAELTEYIRAGTASKSCLMRFCRREICMASR